MDQATGIHLPPGLYYGSHPYGHLWPAQPGKQQVEFGSIRAAAEQAAPFPRRRVGGVDGGSWMQPWQSQFPGASLVRVTQERQGLEISPCHSSSGLLGTGAWDGPLTLASTDLSHVSTGQCDPPSGQTFV